MDININGINTQSPPKLIIYTIHIECIHKLTVSLNLKRSKFTTEY